MDREHNSKNSFLPEGCSFLLWVVGRSRLVNEFELCSKAIRAGVLQQAADRVDVQVFDELPNTLRFCCLGFIRSDDLCSTATRGLLTLGLHDRLEQS